MIQDNTDTHTHVCKFIKAKTNIPNICIRIQFGIHS